MIARAVQSLWTAGNRWMQVGGLALWSLSALLLSRRFRTVSFVGDVRALVLAERLKLPYAEVSAFPDAPWRALANVWSLGKLSSFAVQAEPFIGFDTDVLVTGSLPTRILQSRICFERPVYLANDPHPDVWRNLMLPAHWQRALVLPLRSQWGCGLVGGHDVSALATWASGALAVAEANAELLVDRHGSRAAIMLEQWSAARAFAVADVEPLFYNAMPKAGDECFETYKHLGGHSKIAPHNIALVAAALEREWPGQLARCSAVEAELLETREIEPLW